jgi:hypothetical protein
MQKRNSAVAFGIFFASLSLSSGLLYGWLLYGPPIKLQTSWRFPNSANDKKQQLLNEETRESTVY